MNNSIALSLHTISFAFDKKSKPFFNNLSAEFRANSIHFIQGRNGVGKSTLFRILSGALGPSEQLNGSITINNDAISCSNTLTYRNTIRHHIKVVHQQIAAMLADQFSVQENIQAALFQEHPTYQPLPSTWHYAELLTSFGISLTQPVHLLSGGQKQILAIIMVLQKQAPVLLLDEPTSALDPKNTDLVMEFLQMLSTKLNLTILIINHDSDVLERYATTGYYELYVDERDTRCIRRIAR